jgi:hypothetical protein
MQQVRAFLTDATGHPLKPSEKPVRKYWEYQGIAWHKPPCRIPETDSPEVESADFHKREFVWYEAEFRERNERNRADREIFSHFFR